MCTLRISDGITYAFEFFLLVRFQRVTSRSRYDLVERPVGCTLYLHSEIFLSFVFQFVDQLVHLLQADIAVLLGTFGC